MERPLNIVDIAFQTDVGRHRKHNEDSVAAAKLMGWGGEDGPNFCQVLVVADGVGGMNHGEVASKIAVGRFIAEVTSGWLEALRSGEVDESQALNLISDAFSKTNQAIYELSQEPSLSGMATTLVSLAHFVNDRASHSAVAHAGDSRCYLINGGDIKRLTRDDSERQEMLEAGPKDDQVQVAGNRITNAVGIFPPREFHPTVNPLRLDKPCQVLLCSDGLHAVISDKEIVNVFKRDNGNLIAKRLVELANERGGPDNISVLVGRFG
jgi:PPM family protein phosphatase